MQVTFHMKSGSSVKVGGIKEVKIGVNGAISIEKYWYSLFQRSMFMAYLDPVNVEAISYKRFLGVF